MGCCFVLAAERERGGDIAHRDRKWRQWWGDGGVGHKQEDSVNPESAVKLQALSTHIYLSICLFLSLQLPSLLNIPLSSWDEQDQCCLRLTQDNHNTVKYSTLAEWVVRVPNIHFLLPKSPLLICVYVCGGPHLLVHSNSIQSIIHDADPAVFTWQHKQWHQRLGVWNTYKSL